MLRQTGRKQVCNKIILGVSHNIARSNQDSKIRKKAKTGSFPNYKFQRVRSAEYDEIKHLARLVGNIPVYAPPLLTATNMDCDIAVVGSEGVGKGVEALVEENYVHEKDRVVFGLEDDDPKFSRTFQIGAELLNLKPDDRVLFVAGDLPFFFDYSTLLFDQEWLDYVAKIDMNGRRSIFPTVADEFFSRNFYHSMKIKGRGWVDFKEPNVLQFTGHAIQELLNFIDTLYGNRNSGGVSTSELTENSKGEILRREPSMNPLEWADIIWGGVCGGLRKLGLPKKIKFHESSGNKFASKLFDGNVLVSADHSDPWRLRDVDAWHDLFFYQNIIKVALEVYHARNFGELTNIHPYASQIWSTNALFEEVNQEVPFTRAFYSYAAERGEILGFGNAYEEDGKLLVEPHETENIYGAISDLERRTKKVDLEVLKSA